MTHAPDPLADLRNGFFVECAELLERLQDALTELEDAAEDAAATDPEVVNTAFRAVHSIKGGAGAFGLTALVGFAHRVETVLDALRDGAIRPRAEDVALLIRSADHLADLVSAGAAGTGAPDPAAGIEAGLAALVPGPRPEAAPAGTDAAHDNRPWQVAFRPQAALFASGNEPLFLLQALADLGATDIRCDFAALPRLAALDPEDSYLGWRLTLPATRRGAEIGEIFDFVEDVCDLTMERLAPARPTTTPGTERPAAVAETPSIRVDLDRVDRLMNLVGELAINQSILTQSLSEGGLDAHSALAARLETLTGLTRDIQDSVMTMRAQPVKPLFQRMGRVLRETAAALG
ncbi:MAG: Hpt domain-containing protein, partial [Rhodobacteraceae bacterium]|nr:Hpt domain-containing protein [Paracoccaceae bacterium]